MEEQTRTLFAIVMTLVAACGRASQQSAPLAADSGVDRASTGAPSRSQAGAAAAVGGTAALAAPPTRPTAATPPVAPSQTSDASQAHWPTYGHDAFNTNVTTTETRLSRETLPRVKEHWRVRVAAGATSTPIVFDGLVYFGAWDGHAFAVDAASGEIRWQRRITEFLVRSTPLVTGDRVYFAAGANLVALDRRDGTVLFSTELSPHPDTLLDSSPKLAGDVVVVGLSSIESSVDKARRSFIGGVVGVDAISGERLWRIDTTGEGPGVCRGGVGVAVWSSAAIDETLGLAYIGTGQSYVAPAGNCSDSLIAFRYGRDVVGERVAWVAQYSTGDVYASSPPEATQGADADIGASPNLFEANGRSVVGVGDKTGSYRVFDRSTGELVWRRDGLGIGAFNQAGGVRTTAAVYDGTIYLASNILNELSLAAAAVTGTLAPGEGANIHALDAHTGEPRWQVNVPCTIDGGMVVANDVLFHACTMSGLYARDPKTGEQLWTTPFAYNMGAAISVIDGRIYLAAGYDVVTITTIGSNRDGGQVISLGLDAPATPKVWQAEVANEIAPFDPPRCEAELAMSRDWPSGAAPSAQCSSCLCACDATAAGNCGTCWAQQSCAVQNCAFSAPGDDMHACMSFFCIAKLLPPYLFERGVAVAPCAIQCSNVCDL
jgi:polyvinyl alcohol dehydrogenase (cytochrome)